MNKSIHLFTIVVLGILFLPACHESNAKTAAGHLVPVAATKPVPVADSVHPYSAAGAFQLDTSQSLVGWQASYIAGGGHAGRITPLSGHIVLTDAGTIESGDFVINMHSIRNTDIADLQSRKDLEEHLKSDDFFSSFRFPKAYFKIGSVKPTGEQDVYTIEGPLTIKGVTHPISFKAKVKKSEKMVETLAEFYIDRTKWGINHEAGSVFNGFKDAVISGRVKMSLNLVFWQGEPGKRPAEGC